MNRVFEDCPLTPKQLSSLQALADGYTYKEAAYIEECSVSTIRTHLHDTMQRLGVHTSAHAMVKAYMHGWITIGGFGTMFTLEERLRHGLEWIARHARTLDEAKRASRMVLFEHSRISS